MNDIDTGNQRSVANLIAGRMLPTVYVSVSPFVLTCDALQGAFTKVKKYHLQLPAFCDQLSKASA